MSLFDGYCCEYIFRQPRNYQEFIAVKDAAAVEVFDSYGCDGSQHWTAQACREWWGNRKEIIDRLLHDPEYRKQNGERGTLYVDYLNSTNGGYAGGGFAYRGYGNRGYGGGYVNHGSVNRSYSGGYDNRGGAGGYANRGGGGTAEVRHEAVLADMAADMDMVADKYKYYLYIEWRGVIAAPFVI